MHKMVESHFIQNSTNDLNVFSFQIIKDVETSVKQMEEKITANADPKATIRDTIIVLRELMPKMDDFYTKVLPIMEDIKKLQRQAADQVNITPLILYDFSFSTKRLSSILSRTKL